MLMTQSLNQNNNQLKNIKYKYHTNCIYIVQAIDQDVQELEKLKAPTGKSIKLK